MSGPTLRTVFSTVLALAVAWCLWLPLADVLAYPHRIAVLPNLETDAAAYDAFAWDFAQTRQLNVLPDKHPPGWILALGSVYMLAGHAYVAGKLVSWSALVITVFAAAALARRVFGSGAAAIAALLVASSPGLRAYVGTLQYEVLTGALFAVFLLLTVRTAAAASTRPLMRRAVLAGLAGGMLVITRETFVLVVPLAALWLTQRAMVDRRRTLTAALVLVAVAAAPAVAWSIFQSLEHGRLILVADKTREVFDAGHNPRANGTYNEPLVGIGEPAGLAHIREYPQRTVELTGRKLLYSFGVLRDGWNVPHALSIWIWRAARGIVPLSWIDPIVRGGWLMAACLVAVWMLGRRGLQEWWLIPAASAAILAVHVLTLASFRFTVPLLPALYVLASGPLATLARRVWPALRTPPGAALAGIVLLGFLLTQADSRGLEVNYEAAELEGLDAVNVIDPASGQTVRVGDGQRGERPIALLPDTYLPRGAVQLTARVRVDAAVAGSAPVARLMLVPLEGPPCVGDLVASQFPAGEFRDISILCELPRDGPATLGVITRGTADIAVESLRLRWRGD